MSTTVHLTGRLGADPELRFTPAGKAVASFNLVTSKNTRDEQGNWTESETTWWRVSAWDAMAENIAESLSKGDAVIVIGRAHMQSYEDRDGNTRQSLTVQAYNVGPDLKRAQAKVQRTQRQPGTGSPDSDTAGDPWATPSPSATSQPTAGDPWNANGGSHEPAPF